MQRESKIKRKTKETDIHLSLSLDGQGVSNIDTGIGFFEHMLSTFCLHGGFDIELECKGDLNVDCRHTIEDVVFRKAFFKSLATKGIRPTVLHIPLQALPPCNRISTPALLASTQALPPKTRYGSQMVKEFFNAVAKSGTTCICSGLALA